MERQKPTLVDKLQSERGDLTTWGALLLIAVTAFASCVATETGKDIIDHYNETRPTPTPIPEVGIDTFENFTNSNLQVVFPE